MPVCQPSGGTSCTIVCYLKHLFLLLYVQENISPLLRDDAYSVFLEIDLQTKFYLELVY